MKFSLFKKPATPADSQLLFLPVFVGGPPRSGTTILHAMICSSDKTNGFINECSYFTAFMHPLQIGLNTFDAHTRHYFDSREALIRNHAGILESELGKIWERTGKPDILALKDPMLTPLFPLLGETLSYAKFVVSVRDPRATISSRIEVTQRERPGVAVTDQQIEAFCHEYVHMYGMIANARVMLGERLCLVDYRDVAGGKALEQLTAFGLGTLDSERIWAEPISNPREYADDVWATQLHGRQPSLDSVERFRQYLSPVAEQRIMDMCGPIARELGAI
ncbi:sulfotransferase family protein [Paraburkholderia silvatlantica]|uniref:Sulfotransferase family protein n=1 Tax=Paraburkholderia silvatlantica TaxID=321895 RepID=A0A2V4TLR0_9BURK|nr:sulfotransferase [Paraburkholderia silvatlantica]PYE16613.1 sulfotransferase family protein [Paraburkholderia silvatlantica]